MVKKPAFQVENIPEKNAAGMMPHAVHAIRRACPCRRGKTRTLPSREHMRPARFLQRGAMAIAPWRWTDMRRRTRRGCTRATSARCGGCPVCQRACRCDATTGSCRSWHPGFRTHNTRRHDRCDLSFRRLRRPRAASRHVVPERSFDQTWRKIAASPSPALSALDTLCYRRSAGTGNRERVCASHRKHRT